MCGNGDRSSGGAPAASSRGKVQPRFAVAAAAIREHEHRELPFAQDDSLAAMKRQGKEGEFRSNLHRGGSATLIKITPEERSTAVRAAQTMGLSVAGVDLLRSNHGPVVMEVNSSPGLEGIENATGKNIAGQIIQFLEKRQQEFGGKATGTRTRGRG